MTNAIISCLKTMFRKDSLLLDGTEPVMKDVQGRRLSYTMTNYTGQSDYFCLASYRTLSHYDSSRHSSTNLA